MPSSEMNENRPQKVVEQWRTMPIVTGLCNGPLNGVLVASDLRIISIETLTTGASTVRITVTMDGVIYTDDLVAGGVRNDFWFRDSRADALDSVNAAYELAGYGVPWHGGSCVIDLTRVGGANAYNYYIRYEQL